MTRVKRSSNSSHNDYWTNAKPSYRLNCRRSKLLNLRSKPSMMLLKQMLQLSIINSNTKRLKLGDKANLWLKTKVRPLSRTHICLPISPINRACIPKIKCHRMHKVVGRQSLGRRSPRQ